MTPCGLARYGGIVWSRGEITRRRVPPVVPGRIPGADRHAPTCIKTAGSSNLSPRHSGPHENLKYPVAPANLEFDRERRISHAGICEGRARLVHDTSRHAAPPRCAGNGRGPGSPDQYPLGRASRARTLSQLQRAARRSSLCGRCKTAHRHDPQPHLLSRMRYRGGVESVRRGNSPMSCHRPG